MKKKTEYLSKKDVAKLLELPEITIQRWIQQGKIPYKEINNKKVLQKDEITSWAKTHDLNMKKLVDKNEIILNEFNLSKAVQMGGIYNDINGDNISSVFKNSLIHLLFINKKHKKDILDELINREEMASTGIGEGIAIPHTRNRMALDLETAHIPVFFLKEPIFFNAVDSCPVFVLFMLFTTNLKEHLKMLSKLSFILKEERIVKILNNRNSGNDLLNEIKIIENERS